MEPFSLSGIVTALFVCAVMICLLLAFFRDGYVKGHARGEELGWLNANLTRRDRQDAAEEIHNLRSALLVLRRAAGHYIDVTETTDAADGMDRYRDLDDAIRIADAALKIRGEKS